MSSAARPMLAVHVPDPQRLSRSAIDGVLAGVSYALAFAFGIAVIVALAVVAHEAVLTYLAITVAGTFWIAFMPTREGDRRSRAGRQPS